MINQKKFVANSQPISDNELYNIPNNDSKREDISIPNSVSADSIDSVRGIQEQLVPSEDEPHLTPETLNPTIPEVTYEPTMIPSVDKDDSKKTIEDVANTISGTQIAPNVDTSDVASILSQINSANEDAIREQELKYKEAEDEYAKQQEQLIAKRKAELLKERVADEEAHRKEQEEIERRLEEEERLREEQRANSIKGKVSNLISTFGKNETSDENNQTEPKKSKKQEKAETMDSAKSEEKTVPTDTSSQKEKTSKKDTTDWEYIAKHDTLTGLLNASAYSVDINKASLSSCILFVDANNLKYLNDTYGHEAGDKLLHMVSSMLTRYFKGEAYRIGGDEFVVITTRSEEKIKKIIRNMKSSLERQTKLDKTGMIYSVAIGYAYGDGKTPLSEIRAKADEQMYADKAAYKEAHPTLDKRKQVTGNTELMDLAYTDVLTGLKNHHAFERAENASVLTLVQIIGFDELSRASGDKFAELVGKCMKKDAKKNEDCYYLGNGDFCILSEYTPDVFISTLRANLHSLAIDISTQIMTGADTNEKLLSLAKEVIATPKEKPKSYDERLTAAQRQMKETVAINHEPVVEEDVASMMDIIGQKASEIIMIFMASADFNNLFIFLDVEDFLQVAWDMGTSIDYSYIYAVYPGGALYYGADDYYSEITDLFQRIAQNMSGRDIRAKEIKQIEGINIFENIYIK